MTYEALHTGYKEIKLDEHLSLVEPRINHACFSLEWVKNHEVVQYMGAEFSDPNIEVEQARIQEIIDNVYEYNWMIQCDGKVIGNVSLNSIKETTEKFGKKACMLTILIGYKSFWGKRIGSRVCSAVINWAFKEGKFEIIGARVLKENVVSVKTLKKLGFDEDGSEFYDGLVNGKPSVWMKFRLNRVIQYLTPVKRQEIPKNNQLRKHCYLCLQEKELEEEHVIPRIFFAPRTTDNFVKLWACANCNQILKAPDDEYVTRIMQLISFSSGSRMGFERFLDGVKKGSGKGIMGKMMDGYEKRAVALSTNSDMVISQAGISVDGKRLKAFIERIAKGLYTVNTLQLYDWKDFDISVEVEQLILSQKLFQHSSVDLLRQQGQYREYWREYFYYVGTADKDGSVWSILLYNSFHALVMFRKINKTE